MVRKAESSARKQARRASLKKVFQILGLSESEFAELCGVPYYRINNITRTASRSALDEELALKIQAATGISSGSLLRGEKVPSLLNGGKLTREGFNAWKELGIDEQTKINQAGELGYMAALLLEAAGHKGNYLRRRTYHMIRSSLEEIRRSAGISMNEIHDASRMGAKFHSLTTTRDQLDQELGQAPAYLAIRTNLPALAEIEVILESFPTWFDLDSLPEDARASLPEVIDEMAMTRFIYRIKTGTEWRVVIRDSVMSKGVASSQRRRKIQALHRKSKTDS